MRNGKGANPDNGQTIEQSTSPWKHVSAADWNNSHWQLAHALQGYDALAALLQEHQEDFDAEAMRKTAERYRFRINPYYLSLIDWSDKNDPIRLQSIPDPREMDDAGEFSADPFREEPTAISKGIVHRFQDRVLLAATNNCAMYCRHCTRKNTLGEMCPQENSGFETALQYIAEHPQVREVLISGGDPLLLNTEVLDRLLGRIHSIKHIEVVRIGTRVPVVLPMRVDSELSAMLAGHKPLWINTQFNHPRELTKEALTACRRLTDAGIPVSNQSVLLKGVNDDFETMRVLCAKLQRNLIRPYYLFQCDPIAGIPHFRTDISAGIELEKRLRESIGGLALPCFVVDLPGEKSKIPLHQFMQRKSSGA